MQLPGHPAGNIRTTLSESNLKTLNHPLPQVSKECCDQQLRGVLQEGQSEVRDRSEIGQREVTLYSHACILASLDSELLSCLLKLNTQVASDVLASVLTAHHDGGREVQVHDVVAVVSDVGAAVVVEAELCSAPLHLRQVLQTLEVVLPTELHYLHRHRHCASKCSSVISVYLIIKQCPIEYKWWEIILSSSA